MGKPAAVQRGADPKQADAVGLRYIPQTVAKVADGGTGKRHVTRGNAWHGQISMYIGTLPRQTACTRVAGSCWP